MPVKRRKAKRREGISDEALAWLHGRDETGFEFFEDDADLAALWNANAEWVLGEWITHSPGTRPPAWWVYSAPKPGQYVRHGASGTAMFESDASFLKRLNLFAKGEERRLVASDFEPAPVERPLTDPRP